MNNVVSQDDKHGGESYPNWLVKGFKKVLNDIELVDMELIGHQFTCERRRGKPDWIEVHLDRALKTQNWLNMFPMAKLYNL